MNFLVPDFGFFVMLLISTLATLLPLIAVVVLVVHLMKRRETDPVRGYGSIEGRLQELAQLQTNGVITPEEYDARRAAILESI